MADYYKILGVTPLADGAQIKAAYKRLAMQHHPDRNPGNKEAEELFKEINEAYHVLSDPLKKSKYDTRLFSYYNARESTDAHWQEIRKKRAYQNGARPYQTPKIYRYTFNKKYFKIQGLALIVFIIISGFCFSIMNTIQFFIEQNRAKIQYVNNQFLKRVDTLFIMGKYKEAFLLMDTLSAKNPLEFGFNFRRDSLVGALRNVANIEFGNKNYEQAIIHYNLLASYESPARRETLYRMASCEYYLEHYENSLQALKHLHNKQPYDLDLIYEIGRINFEKLHNTQEALFYLTLGKKLFKRNLTEVYGKAFEIVMEAKDAPEVYYNIFELRAMTNLELKNYSEASTDCNWAIYLRPENGKPYYLRALSKIKNKDFSEICSDLEHANRIESPDVEKLQHVYCH